MRIDKLIEFKDRMEHIIASFFMYFNERQTNENTSMITPPGDSFLEGDNQHIFLDAPSLDEATISLNVRNNALLFRGEKTSQKTNSDTVFMHMERNFGSYMKMLPLAKDEEKYSGLTTTYSDGVLHITITFGG
jgi:HSP20 family molecular chaperone IbpA